MSASVHYDRLVIKFSRLANSPEPVSGENGNNLGPLPKAATRGREIRFGGAATAAVQPGVSDLFAAALAHHQAGRLAEAEVHYRQVLAAIPDHGDALHFLGGHRLPAGPQ